MTTLETARGRVFHIRENTIKPTIVFDVGHEAKHICTDLTRDEAAQIRDTLDAVLRDRLTTYTSEPESVELEAVLSGGLVDELARAAKEHNVSVSFHITPLDDE